MSGEREQFTDYPNSGSQYEEDLTRIVSARLRAGVRSFTELAGSVDGAWPVETAAILESMHKSNLIDDDIYERVRPLEMPSEKGADTSPAIVADRIDLPEPHPLDYDWRFTEATQGQIVAQLESQRPRSVALLGAPSLFRQLRKLGMPVELFDRNQEVIQILSEGNFSGLHCVDLRHPLGPSGGFSFVVADPPWYLDYYEAFLMRSRELLAPDGVLFLSVLPRLTRPNASSDRFEIIRMAYDVGFDLVRIEEGRLHYKTPAFEARSMQSELVNIGDWRKADAFTFRTSERTLASTIGSMRDTSVDEDAEIWHSFRVAGTSFRVKESDRDREGVFDFGGVSESGDLFIHSVSRRSHVRRRANVWSSRNLVLAVTRPECVCHLLKLLEIGETWETAARVVSETNALSSESHERLRTLSAIIMKQAQ